MSSKPIQAWHFVKDNRAILHLHHGKEVKIRKGLVLTCDPDRLEMLRYGLHASENIIDALCHAPGSVICRVECSGSWVKSDDKLVCSERRVLWWINVEHILHEFACRCAEPAINRVKLNDPVFADAIKAKRKWLKKQISDDELAAAGATAWEAARVAAWEAARETAREAAWAAAGAAAWDAERKWQSRCLTQMVYAENVLKDLEVATNGEG